MDLHTLYIFNPEHDLALAVGEGPYTPPAEIVKLRKENTLLPALFADNSDFILSTDIISPEEIQHLPYYDLFQKKNLRLLTPPDIAGFSEKISNIQPWGWDHAIFNLLKNCDTPESLLPAEEKINNIRQLSHRRTTIPFRETLGRILGEEIINPAKELFSILEVENFLELYPLAYFKAPWSSSGRGIVVSDHISRKGLLEWAHGIIRRQGSIIAEPSWNRVFDFATEWIISDEKPVFLGLSAFKTSSRGKYHDNFTGSQSEIFQMIKNVCPNFGEHIIRAQYEAIRQHLSSYEGYLGIDMLADNEGRINNCVEINLRMTMGIVPLLNNKDDSYNW